MALFKCGIQCLPTAYTTYTFGEQFGWMCAIQSRCAHWHHSPEVVLFQIK